MHLWTESRRGNNYFLVFIWINYTDLSHFFFLYIKHTVLESSARIKQNKKTENKQIKQKQSKDNHVQHRESPPFTLLLDNILYIYIYTVCVYFCHSYKNKIRYCRCATIHTRWKQNTEKLYSPHWGQRYTRLFKKKVKEKKEGIVSPLKKINTWPSNCTVILPQPTKHTVC